MNAQKYILNSSYLGRVELKTPPDGWDSQGIIIARDPQYHGVFEEISLSFRFPKDGREYIRGLYEEKGIHDELQLIIQELDENDNYRLAFKGRGLMDSYNVTELYVELSFVELNDMAEIRNIEDRKVNLLTEVDKEGNFIYGDDRRKSITIEPKTIVLQNKLETIENVESFPVAFRVGIPMRPALNESDFKSQSIAWNDNNGAGAFWKNETDVPQSFKLLLLQLRQIVDYNFSVFDGTFKLKFFVLKYVDDESPLAVVSETELQSESNNGSGGTTRFIHYQYQNLDFTVQPGEFVTFVMESSSSNPENYDLSFDQIQIFIDQYSVYRPTTAKVMLPDEAFTAILQHATGKHRIFYSEIFGRPDSEFFTYSELGKGALTSLTNGKNLREFQEAIYTTFGEMFFNFSCLYNLGMGIEMVNGHRCFRIEPVEHFYSNDIIFTLQANEIEEVSKRYAAELAYSDIKAGFEKWSGEDFNNLDEPNGIRDYITYVSKLDNPLDIRCTYIGGCYLIEFTRRQNKEEAPNKSYRFDNDIFFIVLKPDYTPEYAGGFDDAHGMLFPENALNMRITPSRTLKNWGNILLASQYKLPRVTKVIFTSQGPRQETTGQGILNPVYHEGNNLFVSDIEGVGVDESKPVDIIGDSPIYLPEFYQVTGAFTREHLTAIRNNRKGKIEVIDSYGAKIRGHIWRIEANLHEKKATYLLLRSNG